MNIFILLLMNLIVIAGCFLITYRLFRGRGSVDSLLCWFILYLSQVILVELCLGVLGILYLHNLILAHSAVFFLVYLTVRKQSSCFSLKGRGQALGELLQNKAVLLCASLILGFGIVKAGINLVNPPFGWDNLNYHFTFPVEWLKHGNLQNPPVVFCDPSPAYYPINGSLFFFWLMLPLKNVFIADLGQIPFFIAAFLAVCSLGRKLSLSKEYAVFAASLFTLIPNYFKQLEIAYVDVMVAALFLAALNFLFLLYRSGSLKDAVLYGLCLGLMLGTKTTAVPFAFLLLVPFLYYCLRRFSLKKTPALFFGAAIAVILTGGFSYARNFMLTGNPLYPLNLKLFGRVVFKGVIDRCVYQSHFLPEDYNLGKILFSEGLGAQTVLFVLPAIFFGLPLALFKNRRGRDFNRAYFMALPLLLIFVYRFLIPLANLRYLYALLGIAMVIAFYAAERMRVPAAALRVLAALCALGSAAELAKRGELVVSFAAAIILFFLLPPALKGMINKKFKAGVISALICGVIFLPVLNRDYTLHEYPRYVKMVKYSGFWPDAARAWAWLDRNTAGDNIAYAGRPVPFPLYGRGFKNNVYYVSVNRTEPARLHYFAGSKYVWGYDGESVQSTLGQEKNYRGLPDPRAWLTNLLKRGTGYLFVYSLHQIKAVKFPLEDEWARGNPQIFRPVFSNGTIRIYKVKR